MSSDDKGTAAAPKRVESDVYDRQIRLWGADAQVSALRLFFSAVLALWFCKHQSAVGLIFSAALTTHWRTGGWESTCTYHDGSANSS